MVCVTRGAALRETLAELCPVSLIAVEDSGRIDAALADSITVVPRTIFVIDHDVPFSAGLADRLTAFIALDGRAIVGESAGPPGSVSLITNLIARGVAVDEICSASNALQLDVGLVVAIGFPGSRELAAAQADRDGGMLGRSAGQLLN